MFVGRNLLITRSNINGDFIPPDQQSILFLISFILLELGVFRSVFPSAHFQPSVHCPGSHQSSCMYPTFCLVCTLLRWI